MATLGLRIDENFKKRLEKVSEFSKRSKSQIALFALESYLEDIEFWMDAKKRYEEEETTSYDEFKKHFSLN